MRGKHFRALLLNKKCFQIQNYNQKNMFTKFHKFTFYNNIGTEKILENFTTFKSFV